MNLTHLSAFRAVMTSASLTEAAERLGRTQPAISASLKSLEEQLGMKLFERRGRKLIPVPEAQYFLAEAESILSQMTRVRQTMRSMSAGKKGMLNVAAMPGPVSMIFPKFIASRIQESDDIAVSLQARTSNQIAELARAQAIDFGFADAPEGDDAENLYDTETITGDCLVALPSGHALTAKRKIAVEDIANEPFGILPASHHQSRDLQSRFQARGLTLNATVESQTFLPILQFVAAGQCCTLLDPLSVFLVSPPDAMVHGIVVRPMTEPFRYRYAIFSPRYRPISAMAGELREVWRKEVMKLLDGIGANPRCEPIP